MKVLLMFTYNITLEMWEKGGFLQRELNFYHILQKKDIGFSFLTYGNSNDLKYSKILNGIEIIPISEYLKTRIPKFRLFKSLLLPLKLKALFKKIDIITTVQVEGSWVAYLAKLLYGKKLIVRGGYEKFRNFLALSKVESKGKLLLHLYLYIKIYIQEYIAYRLADAIMITSESDIDFIIKAFKLKRRKDKIYNIPNFIDINLFKPLNIEQKEKQVLYVGRLHSEKNLDNLLKAFKDLDGFALNIIGKGPFDEYLNNWKEKYKINVNYLGVIPNEQLPEIINQHQIFILPSYYEGNPKTLLEAMSCGAACIGTNVRGIKSIIKHKENGYLCNTDAQSIKKAIISVANNKELRESISKAARKYIINTCSLDTIVEKEFALFKKVMKI